MVVVHTNPGGKNPYLGPSEVEPDDEDERVCPDCGCVPKMFGGCACDQDWRDDDGR